MATKSLKKTPAKKSPSKAELARKAIAKLKSNQKSNGKPKEPAKQEKTPQPPKGGRAKPAATKKPEAKKTGNLGATRSNKTNAQMKPLKKGENPNPELTLNEKTGGKYQGFLAECLPPDWYKPEGRGRPPAMTPETLSKLEVAFALGAKDETACFFARITTFSLYEFQRRFPEFTKQKELLKKRPSLVALNSVVRDMATDGNLALKYLERKERDEFALRHVHSGAIAHYELTDEEMENLDDMLDQAGI